MLKNEKEHLKLVKACIYSSEEYIRSIGQKPKYRKLGNEWQPCFIAETTKEIAKLCKNSMQSEHKTNTRRSQKHKYNGEHNVGSEGKAYSYKEDMVSLELDLSPALQKLLRSLDERNKRIVCLRYHNYKVSEIADELQINRRSVYKRLSTLQKKIVKAVPDLLKFYKIESFL